MKNTRSHEPTEQYCAQQRSTQTNTQIYMHTFIPYIYQKQTSQININGQTVKNQI